MNLHNFHSSNQQILSKEVYGVVHVPAFTSDVQPFCSRTRFQSLATLATAACVLGTGQSDAECLLSNRTCNKIGQHY